MKDELFGQIFRNIQISSLMEILPGAAKLFHADRRTDMTKLIVPFRNFANAPTNERLVEVPPKLKRHGQ